jgi:hypothetical protein
MNSIGKRLMLSAAVAAAAVFFTSTSGLPGAVDVAAAAPLAHQATFATDAGTVILAKDFKCCGKGGDGGIPPGPGGFKDGGGDNGKGGKGGKGGSAGWGPGVAGAVILGLAHCAIQTERCEGTYGADTDRYWRCVRRSGC